MINNVMRITLLNGVRTLIKDCGAEVNISDKNSILYTGFYYKTGNNILKTIEIETSFIGKICGQRYHVETGTTGIYVDPLFIFNKTDDKWNKISNASINTNIVKDYKYFLYPHLLLLPDSFYHFRPIYTLHTVENRSLSDFDYVIENMKIDLDL